MTVPTGPAFAHLFGLENYNGIFSETEMQANISALSGTTITSAILSYSLVNGVSGSQGVTVTSYSSNGVLSYNETPPSNLGSTSFTSNGLSSNSVDVTSLVQNAVSSNAAWLGLYVTPNGPGDNSQWTWTSQFAGGGNPDSADVRPDHQLFLRGPRALDPADDRPGWGVACIFCRRAPPFCCVSATRVSALYRTVP